jgi:competence protein ComFC
MIFECILCKEFSFEVICKECQKKFLKPEIKFKNSIISFYDYEEIEELIKYKYHKFGSRVFHVLAKNSFFLFSKYFFSPYKEKIFVIPIDDKVKKGYSHTAILAKYLDKKFKILYSSLIATNDVKYAGKPLEFRLKNPRNYKYNGPKKIKAILVDDIATTGVSINEAINTLKNHNVDVLFSLTLANLKA